MTRSMSQAAPSSREDRSWSTIARLTLHPEPTKSGDRYWRFTNGSVAPEKGVPIWASEIDWFIESLSAVAAGLDPSLFRPNAQPYPLLVRAGGSTVLLLMLRKNELGQDLIVERWSSAVGAPRAGEQRIFSTYWYKDFKLQTQSGISIPLREDWPAALSDCAATQRAILDAALEADWRRLVRHQDLPHAVPPRSRVTIARKQAPDPSRRTPWYPSCPDAGQAVILPKPIRSVLFEAAAQPVSAEGLVQRIQHALDRRSITEQLPWTARYENATLADSVFFGLVTMAQSDLYLATRVPVSFTSDPLLSALVEAAPPAAAETALGPIPQDPERRTLKELQGRGLIGGFLATVLGRYPKPAESRVKATRKAAEPSKRLRRERWRVLQLAQLEAASQSNFTDPRSDYRVLGWQRLALLRHDAEHHFSDDRVGLVAGLLDELKGQHVAILAGKASQTILVRSRDLPKP